MKTLAWTLAAAVLGAAFAASAAPGAKPGAEPGAVYEWIDDSGRMQASDTVPDKYKAVARRIDPNRYRVPAGEQAEAERQAATMKAKAASAAPLARPAAATSRPGPAQAASLSGSPSAADSPQCVAWRRQVAANQECFVYSSNRKGRSTMHSCSNEPDPAPPPGCGPAGSQ